MKVDEFLSKSDVAKTSHVPGQLTVDEVIAEVEAEEPEYVTSLTPSGLEVYYSWAPRRHYKVRWENPPYGQSGFPDFYPWREVPSVTAVLSVLDKPALPWWGMKTGVDGLAALVVGGDVSFVAERCTGFLAVKHELDGWVPATAENVVPLLTKNKLTVNHVKDSASKRGLSVHAAFEAWASDQTYRANPELFEKNEQGFIAGLNLFLNDIAEGGVTDVEAEVMVGSIVHGFAGRFDVRYRLQESCEVTTRVYPKKAAKREAIPAGRYLKDVKSSKNVYPSHALQLAGYELASVEDGYEPTDHRAVIHLTADGKYELVRTHATADDFLSILAAHNTMSKSKGWT